MKAVVCARHGAPETLEIRDLPQPVPGPGEVLVKVAAIGLNFFDTLIIRDLYQVKPELPFSPGAEYAGHVAALGEGVTGFAVGERVCGYQTHGAARGYVAAPAQFLAKVPDDLDLVKAAGLIVTYGTALYALRDAVAELMGYARDGRISAHVDKTFPLEHCAEALGEISGRRVKGKVVLTVAD